MERPNTLPLLSDINLHEIAQRSGISVGYLSLILKGKRKNVSLSVVTRLAFAFNLSVEEVKGWILMTSEEAQTEIPKRKEWDEEVQSLILRILKSLEKFDALQLKELMSEAERLPSQIPLKLKLIEWIEGIFSGQNSQFNQALDHFMQARTFRARKSPEKRMLAKIYGAMGGCYTALGNHKMAFKMFAKSLNIWGSGADAALVYLNMGTLYRRCHKYRYASQSYLQAIEIGSCFIQIMAYSGLGQIGIDQKDFQGALGFLYKGYQLSRHQSDLWGVPELYCNLGIVYKLSSRYNEAKEILYEGKVLAERLGAVRVKHYILLELEEVLLLLQEKDEAYIIFSHLAEELSDEGDLLLLGKILLAGAQNLWNSSRKLSLDCLLKSYQILGRIGPSNELLKCCQLLAEVFVNNNNLEMSDFYQDEVKRIRKAL